ncbi:ALDH-like protein [Coprinopsis marcescibilis]|uniref:ALDH-like protein n=1 Tax=Coprinopsis marcescibilis TaxID=230819 RepID=A0A5C3KK11_COPMA|nr:ALDH-like protein [Coprinopsis marcescibilis]
MLAGPALATGNVIVLKPSEITPLTALRFADLVVEAGFPPGVVNIINGFGHTAGQAISEHPHISKVAFTGSTLVGKSPTIVFDDADLDQAAKWAAAGVFSNMGQMCVAGSRIFVQEGVCGEFVAKISAAAKALGNVSGDPFAEGTQHGPQISKIQVERVMSYIESGKAEGATVHVGGARIGNKGYFVQPTVFTDVKSDMKIAQEEIFGPVTAVFKFKAEEGMNLVLNFISAYVYITNHSNVPLSSEVIELANDTIYGLAAYVFSESIRGSLRVANALEAGSINSANLFDPGMPFGGYKQSGIGRELGEYAIESYTQAKSIHINLGIRL